MNKGNGAGKEKNHLTPPSGGLHSKGRDTVSFTTRVRINILKKANQECLVKAAGDKNRVTKSYRTGFKEKNQRKKRLSPNCSTPPFGLVRVLNQCIEERKKKKV